jgi:acyl-homoserine lactone synthase
MITHENRHLYATELKEMHELRRIHFVEERGWAAMQVRDGGEYDDSDDERAIYFLALDGDGHVAVSMRARPTDDRCIVADVFPQLIEPESGDVRGSDIWEISRIFATKNNRLRQGIRRRNEVLLASIEAAAQAGITRLVAMVDTFLWPQVLRYPWNIAPLGLPGRYPEGEAIGFGVTVNKGELARVRTELGVRGSVIVPAMSASTLSPQEMELLLTAGRLAPKDLALVKEMIAWARKTGGTEEQFSAIVERKQAQRNGAGLLH